jgi:hypothetical protein
MRWRTTLPERIRRRVARARFAGWPVSEIAGLCDEMISGRRAE